MKFGTSSIFLFYQSIEAVTDDKRVLKHIMIDILNLRNGMEDNLLLIQQINLMIQKEGEEQKGFDDVIHAAQQHIDSINTVYILGVSWLKDENDFALSFIQGNLLGGGKLFYPQRCNIFFPGGEGRGVSDS